MLVYLARARLFVDDLYRLTTITRQYMRKKWSGFSRTCRTGSAGPAEYEGERCLLVGVRERAR